MHDPIIGHPDSLSSELDDIGEFADVPRRSNLPQSFHEGPDLSRHISARVAPMRNQTVARLEQEAPGLAFLAPAQFGLEPEITAKQHRRQERGNLQPIFCRRGEEAQGPVDLEGITVAHAPFDPVHQAVKLEPPEELPVSHRPLISHLDPHAGRAQQHRLGEPDVVAVDEPLCRHIVERQQSILAA